MSFAHLLLIYEFHRKEKYFSFKEFWCILMYGKLLRHFTIFFFIFTEETSFLFFKSWKWVNDSIFLCLKEMLLFKSIWRTSYPTILYYRSEILTGFFHQSSFLFVVSSKKWTVTNGWQVKMPKSTLKGIPMTGSITIKWYNGFLQKQSLKSTES